MTPWAIILWAGGADDRADRLLRVVAGQSLLGRAIALARACRPIAALCVCSSDEEVLSVARREGLVVVSDDSSACSPRPTPSQVDGVVCQLGAEGRSPTAAIWVSPLYPLLLPKHLEGAARVLAEGAAVFAAVEVGGTLWRQDGGAGEASPVSTGGDGGRLLVEAGAFFGQRTGALRRGGHSFPAGAVPFLLTRESALRAETLADLYAAEALLRDRQTALASASLPNPLGAIVFDFDGVFTDNRVLVFEDGREAALCDRGDGWGLGQLRKKFGVPILVLSTERNPIVRERCRKLGLECIHDVPDKLPVLHEWLEGRRIRLSSVAYVGNDLNDLACMKAVGCPIAVADAYPQVRSVARIVLSAPGGKGAVREVTNLVAGATAVDAPWVGGRESAHSGSG